MDRSVACASTRIIWPRSLYGGVGRSNRPDGVVLGLAEARLGGWGLAAAQAADEHGSDHGPVGHEKRDLRSFMYRRGAGSTKDDVPWW